MKVSIIGCAGIPAQYGGFETLAENLVKYKIGDINYTVFCTSKLYTKQKQNYLTAELKYLNISANGKSSTLYDFISMMLSLKSDVMLILGVSGSFFLPFIRLIYKGKVITNIDGIEWKRAKWNKYAKKFLKLSESIAVRFSDVVVADNKAIIDYVFSAYKTEAVLIEYGANHLDIKNINTQEYFFLNSQYAFSVCRIEPENNIALILDAFCTNDVLPIVIVGNWKNSAYGCYLYDKYQTNPNIILLDPIYISEKLNYLRVNATCYIHGHSAGGTNPSLVEAMYLSLPIFAYDCIYNRETTENKCSYWSNSPQLHNLLKESTALNLDEIRKNMKEIADRRYSWNQIVIKYEEIFCNS